jgi:mRNA interferase RelE/StbE
VSGRYTVEFERSAKKEFDRLEGPIRARVLRKVAALEDDPRPPGATRLIGADDLWRIRIGDYRVVYATENDHLVVIVVRSQDAARSTVTSDSRTT